MRIIGYLGFHWSDLNQSGLLVKLLGSGICTNRQAREKQTIKPIRAEPRWSLHPLAYNVIPGLPSDLKQPELFLKLLQR
jgi:hypothetical protein